MFRRVHKRQLVQQRARLFGRKRLVQRSTAVGTQIVHHQRDPMRLWKVFFHQATHTLGPCRGRMVGRHVDPPPIVKGRIVHQQMTHPIALVLGIVAGRVSRERRQRRTHLARALLGALIHADHRTGRVIGTGVHVKDVLHRTHEGRVLLRRYAPHLLTPRLEFVFFST